MKEISVVNLASVNIEKLDADLRTFLSTRYGGLSIRRGEVLVFMADDTPSADVLQVRRMVENHDARQLTTEQAAKIARVQAIDTARTSNSLALNLSDYDASDALIRTLAQKIEWLELELRDLRDLD
jgi:hypothetical protein